MRGAIGTAGIAAALLALAACGGGDGGELRGARTAAAGDTADTAAVVQDSAYDLPVFADTTGLSGPAPVPADTPPAAKPDTAPTTPPGPPAVPAPSREWTSGVRSVVRTGVGATLREVRFGRNEGFDRMVLDFGGPIPGYRIEYVRPVQQCGSGEAVRLAGEAALVVHLHSTRAHDDAGRPTIGARERPLQMPVIREMEIVCDFEGETAVAIGVAAPNRFRVLELPSGVLAIDVQQ